MGHHVAVAVGCSVGIPVGVSFIIAALLWLRIQRRNKKEDIRDHELENVIRDESGHISFDNLETWQETQKEKKDFYVNNNESSLDSSGNHISSSSEQLPQPSENHYHDEGKKKHNYVPAYRRKLNSYRIRQLPTSITGDGKNSVSNVSLDSMQILKGKPFEHQETVYDQIIPVLADTESKLSSGDKNNNRENAAFVQQTQHENERILMKNIRNNDFGSYPRGTQSAMSLSHSDSNSNTNANVSGSSLHTRSPSVMSTVRRGTSEDNVFDTPKSSTAAASLVDVKVNINNSGQQGYSLKNNYENGSEIREEDQYENEFTNYSENKRAFIDTLKPKPGL